jgi:glucose/arabinose dehydrogenase
MPDDSHLGRYTRRRALVLVGAAGLAGCSTIRGDETTMIPPVDERYDPDVSHSLSDWDGLDRDWTAPSTSPAVDNLGADVLIENLEIPWDLSFAGDGTLFISERVGRVLAFDGNDARVIAEPEDAIDAEAVEPGEDHDSWWVDGGEGGTLGVAAHPTYSEPPLVYVYYTAETDDGTRNRVVAFDPTAEDPATGAGLVVGDIPADGIHNGGRLTFGPANYLWITCGDAGEAQKSQDPTTLHGAVLRVKPNGDPVPDNPDMGVEADPRIYTYGHRNPQGIVWLPDGTAVVSEHGPDGRDELNRLEAGADYGWPDVRKKNAYLGVSGVHRPLANSGEPSWAPTGSLFYTGDAVPSLSNRMLVGGLHSQQLLIATLTTPDGTLPPLGEGGRHDGDWSDDAYTVTTHTALADDFGRIRHVEQGPEGEIYLITSNRDGRARDPFPTERDDVLVRLTGP